MNEETKDLLAHLNRGGQYAYFWTLPDKFTHWFAVGEIPPVPNGASLDVFWGVNPTNKNGTSAQRATLGTIGAMNVLYAEFDFKDFQNREACLWWVKTLAPTPTDIIESGGGLHLYWRLTEPLILDSDELRQSAAVLQAVWVQVVEGDEGAKDLARVLRVPGTLNQKYDPPAEVRIIESTGTTYPVEPFYTRVKEYLVKHPREAQRSTPAYAVDSYESGSRNRRLFSFARSCFMRGFSDSEVLAVVRVRNLERCSPSIDDREVLSIVQSAGRYGRDDGGESYDEVLEEAGRKDGAR